MDPLRSIRKSYVSNTVYAIATLVILASLVSAAALYYLVDLAPDGAYAERLATYDTYQELVIKESLYVFVGFSLVVLLGVVAYSLYFSHKVSGPLVRIRYFARDLAGGDFSRDVVIRSGDAIHPVAEAADACAKKYRNAADELGRIVDGMLDDASKMEKALQEGGSPSPEARESLAKAAQRLRKMREGIRV